LISNFILKKGGKEQHCVPAPFLFPNENEVALKEDWANLVAQKVCLSEVYREF